MSTSRCAGVPGSSSDDGRRAGQYGRQAVHLAIRSGELLASDGELREDHLEMGRGGLCGPRSVGDRRLAQPVKHVFRH